MKKLLVVSVIALVLFLSAMPIMKVAAVADLVYKGVFWGSSTERWVYSVGRQLVDSGDGTYTAYVVVEVYSNNTVYVLLELTGYISLDFLLDLRVMRETPSGMIFITASKIFNYGNYMERFSVVIMIYPNGQLKMRLMELYISSSSNPAIIETYVNYVTAVMAE